MTTDLRPHLRRTAAAGWWVLAGLVVAAVVAADLVLLPAAAPGIGAGSPPADDPLRAVVWTIVEPAGR